MRYSGSEDGNNVDSTDDNDDWDVAVDKDEGGYGVGVSVVDGVARSIEYGNDGGGSGSSDSVSVSTTV